MKSASSSKEFGGDAAGGFGHPQNGTGKNGLWTTEVQATSLGDNSGSVFTARTRLLFVCAAALWFLSLLYFWIWWLDPSHVISGGRYIATTIVVAFVTVLPGYLVFHIAQAIVPGSLPDKTNIARVAMVVTKAPSEPFAIVRKTLEGCLHQSVKGHTVWLADERPDVQTRRWCRANGVLVCSRENVPDYHRPTWPRRTRCKEGNLAYFYDRYGYSLYDFVAQFDADHVPEPGYLASALAPFADPRVGYVSAPSICDANAADSWSARGRLHAEAAMHGALQCGYNNGGAPLCIGSHYTVRTAALRQIGGLGPELAEDHSTTLMFNAHGWRGMHAVNAIAHGDGPQTFADLAIQEFQWARSLVTILLQWSPRLIGQIHGRRRFQFLFSQLWYPLFSSIMFLMFLLPVYALWSGHQMVLTTYPEFLLHFLPSALTLIILIAVCRSTGSFRPIDAPLFSWEAAAFLFLRWPWSLAGVIVAIIDVVRGKVAGFRITPKGGQDAAALPIRFVTPYLAMAAVAALTAALVRDPGSAGGFYIFNLFNALLYGGLALLVLWRHARENGLARYPKTLGGVTVALCMLAISAVSMQAARANGAYGLAALTAGIKHFTIAEIQYRAAGAGRRGDPIVVFVWKWRESVEGM